MTKRRIAIGGANPVLLIGLAHVVSPICDVAVQTSEVQDWIKSTADESISLAIGETAENAWKLDAVVAGLSVVSNRAPVLAIVPAARLSEYASKYAAIERLKLLPSVISSDTLFGAVKLQLEELGRSESKSPATPLSKLTPRQLHILIHLCRAESTKRIAELLNISVRTVEFHKYRMMKILGAGSTTELVLRGVAAGMGSESKVKKANGSVVEPSSAEPLYSRAVFH